jgi:hypothetical protein
MTAQRRQSGAGVCAREEQRRRGAKQVKGIDRQSSVRRLAPAASALTAAVLACAGLTASASPAAALPDGRAWELVSPPNKHGAPLEPITEEGGLIQAAAGGGAFAYVALGPINAEPQGVPSPHDSQLLARREGGGWQSQDITAPREEISTPLKTAGFPSEYNQLAEDLSAAILEPEGATALSPLTSERTPYRREADGEFVPLVTMANVPAGTEFGGTETTPGGGLWQNGVGFLAATPDLSHAVLSSPQILSSGFQPSFTPTGLTNLYELTAGRLQLVSVLPNEDPAAEAGLAARLGRNNLNLRGAISDNGERVFFETTGHLYMRETALGRSLQLDEAEAGAVGGAGAAEFQGASSDGSKVFFSDAAQLTKDSTARPGLPDLYMCEVKVDAEGQLSCALSDLSVDPHAGEAANLEGNTVSAIDSPGEHVYFAANGVLTDTPNEHGEHAIPGDCNEKHGVDTTCNLYTVNTVTRELSLVAVLSSADAPDWLGQGTVRELADLTARSSPDGRYLAFMSQRPLTGYDNRDAVSAQPDEEVYLYDSTTGSLRCASCDPSGRRPHGVLDKGGFPGLLVDHPKTWEGNWLAGSIPGWTSRSLGFALYQSRYLSNSGRLFFDSPSPLVAKDGNGVEDVYQYEPPGVGSCASSDETYSPASGGCVALISSGTSAEESAFLDASESGDEVFFLSAARLLRSDVDSAFDVYDARVCSAASPCIKESEAAAPCEGDSCQGPIQAPSALTPASLTYTGPGNLTPPPLAAPAKAKPPTKAELLAKALKSCHKKKARKQRLSCEKQARKRYGAKSAAKSSSAGARAAHGSAAR